jgi:ubiquitin fusion degradation protein 1
LYAANLDFENPWMFLLRNPANQAASTHAGVLEFIADEGCVHLPHWVGGAARLNPTIIHPDFSFLKMMKTLRLNEGDPIRVTGARLPKGKFIKLQAQTVDFIEVSDPKAVYVSQALHYSDAESRDLAAIQYLSSDHTP